MMGRRQERPSPLRDGIVRSHAHSQCSRHCRQDQPPWTHVRINMGTGLVMLLPEVRLDYVGPVSQERLTGAEDAIRLTHKAGLSFPIGAAGT